MARQQQQQQRSQLRAAAAEAHGVDADMADANGVEAEAGSDGEVGSGLMWASKKRACRACCDWYCVVGVGQRVMWRGRSNGSPAAAAAAVTAAGGSCRGSGQ